MPSLPFRFQSPRGHLLVLLWLSSALRCSWVLRVYPLGSQEYDATELMRRKGPFPSLGKVLIDQGSADNFLTGERNLMTAVITRSKLIFISTFCPSTFEPWGYGRPYGVKV